MYVISCIVGCHIMRQYNTIKLILPLGVSLLGFSGPSGVLGPCPGLSLVSVLSRSRLSSQFSVLGSPATHAPGGHSRLALRLVWREFEEIFLIFTRATTPDTYVLTYEVELISYVKIKKN